MKSDGNNLIFLKTKLTKLDNLVQFKRVLMSYLENWDPWVSTVRDTPRVEGNSHNGKNITGLMTRRQE